MSNRTRPTYPPEFRLEAAQLVVDQNYKAKEAASVVGVGISTIGEWLKQIREERNGITPKRSAMTPEQQEVKELKKKPRCIEEHNDILEMATTLLLSDSLSK